MQADLHTPRLRLRPPRTSDAAAAYDGWARDTHVLRYLGLRPHADAHQTRVQLGWEESRWHKRSAWTWLLLTDEPASPARSIGLISLTPQRLDGPAHHLRLGYLLARDRWGQGLMSEALAAVLEQAWRLHPGLWRIDAVCDVDNLASARLLERQGFEREGLMRRHSLHPNISDQPRDVWLYAAVRPTPG